MLPHVSVFELLCSKAVLIILSDSLYSSSTIKTIWNSIQQSVCLRTEMGSLIFFASKIKTNDRKYAYILFINHNRSTCCPVQRECV